MSCIIFSPYSWCEKWKQCLRRRNLDVLLRCKNVAKVPSKWFNPYFLWKLSLKMIYRHKCTIKHANDKHFESVKDVNYVFFQISSRWNKKLWKLYSILFLEATKTKEKWFILYASSCNRKKRNRYKSKNTNEKDHHLWVLLLLLNIFCGNPL